MRLHLTRRTDLVVRCLRALQSDGRLTAAQLAEAAGTSRAYIPQVMAPLIAAAWVASGSGRNGGYALTVDVGALSLLDVIEAVEGPLDGAGCVLFDRACHPQDPCLIHEPWTTARRALAAELAQAPVLPSGGEQQPPAPAEPRSGQLQGDHR